MKSAENTSSTQALKKQPEEFDLVILGGGTGSTVAAWTFAGEGTARRSRRSQIHWRIVPEHRLPAEQERHSQREGRIVLSPKPGVWHLLRWLHDRHGGCP